MTLTKAHIAKTIHDRLHFTNDRSAQLVDSLLEILKKTLENGEDILISGFGKFCVREKRERRGRNPHTGEDLMLAPRKVIVFICSGVLRDKINGKVLNS
jgi:integration host factor subunit alpha